MEQIDLSKIPESSLYYKQIRLMIFFGALLGFRGSDEHTYLDFHQICCGFFPSNHPLYPDFEWWGLNAFLNDKTNHLSSKNDFVREEKDALGKFPVLSDGENGNVQYDFGGSIKRYYESVPEPMRVGRFYKAIDKSGTAFCAKKVIGKDSVTEMVREGFRMCGLERWEVIRPHALRGFFASILANNENVNLAECMAACRHKSAKTNARYIQTGNKTECNKLLALLPGTAPTATTKPSFEPELPPTGTTTTSTPVATAPEPQKIPTVLVPSPSTSSHTISPPPQPEPDTRHRV